MGSTKLKYRNFVYQTCFKIIDKSNLIQKVATFLLSWSKGEYINGILMVHTSWSTIDWNLIIHLLVRKVISKAYHFPHKVHFWTHQAMKENISILVFILRNPLLILFLFWNNFDCDQVTSLSISYNNSNSLADGNKKNCLRENQIGNTIWMQFETRYFNN